LTEYQNIYDDPVFFAGYKKLRDEDSSLNHTLEQPALWSLVGDSLEGLSVLDLGCGFGNFARKARSIGADSVLGIDVSENMLTVARERTSDIRIEYRRASVEDLMLPERGFDLVVSSLMLHYVRRARWFIDGVVKYHRTIETYVNGLS
jgi:ubiquinone/menaquinone biosynthesis C-methylase UbiE